MRIVVVDDEALARERLISLLKDEEGAEVIGEASDGDEALLICRRQLPDLVLLDIRMPGTDGMAVARALAEMESPPAVIFTTAFSEHAVDAFDTAATDYLLKPIRRQRLQEALSRVAAQQPAPVTVGDNETTMRRSYIVVQRQGNVQRVPIEEVCFFLADSKYVSARLKRGEALLEEPLKKLEDDFSYAFIRVHRNALVARALIYSMDRSPTGGYRVWLEGINDPLDVSRRHVSEVRNLIKARG